LVTTINTGGSGATRNVVMMGSQVIIQSSKSYMIRKFAQQMADEQNRRAIHDRQQF
jgi:hypothetical protein